MVDLLIRKGDDVDFSKPLSRAISGNDAEVATLLIENGAKVNSEVEIYDKALFEAVRQNGAEMATVLVEKGPEANFVDKFGATALLIESERKIAALIIENGGSAARFSAVWRNLAEMTTVLHERGAEVNSVEVSPSTLGRKRTCL